MPFPQLAIDILDHILPHLSNDALQKCCLVASPFTAPCQKRLFASLALLAQSRPLDSTVVSKYQRLLDVVEASPHLIGYVKKLDLVWRQAVGDPDDAALLPLLQLFGSSPVLNINTLKLIIHAGPLKGLPPDERWKSIMQPLLPLLLFPGLQKLKLNFFRCCVCMFPVDLLKAIAPNLRHLSIPSLPNQRLFSDCSHVTHPTLPVSMSARKDNGGLVVLALGNAHPAWLFHFLNARNFPCRLMKVRRVVIDDLTPVHAKGLETILAWSAESIDTLELIYGHTRARFVLPHLPRLHTMILRVSAVGDGKSTPLYALLREGMLPRAIEQLVLIVDDFSLPLLEAKAPGFELGNGLFDFFEEPPRLRDISIYITFTFRPWTTLKTDLEMRTYFPKLNSTGKLSVRVVDILHVNKLVKYLYML